MPILQEHKWCTDPPHKKTEDPRPPFRQTRRTKTHRNIILSIPRAPVQKGTFHQLCTNHSAVVLWHWSFTRSTWDQSLFYGPSWNLCFYALYKLQIQSWRNQNTWLRHWMYRLFQPTENEKGACKDCSSFSMQTHPIWHNRIKPEIPFFVLQAYTALGYICFCIYAIGISSKIYLCEKLRWPSCIYSLRH